MKKSKKDDDKGKSKKSKKSAQQHSGSGKSGKGSKKAKKQTQALLTSGGVSNVELTGLVSSSTVPGMNEVSGTVKAQLTPPSSTSVLMMSTGEVHDSNGSVMSGISMNPTGTNNEYTGTFMGVMKSPGDVIFGRVQAEWQTTTNSTADSAGATVPDPSKAQASSQPSSAAKSKPERKSRSKAAPAGRSGRKKS